MKILRGLSLAPLAAALLLLLAPLMALVLPWLNVLLGDTDGLAVLHDMLQTVLPSYALDTVLLCLMVAVVAGVMGTTSAVLVTVFEFPGRRLLEWALLLPLAMPAYVVAYAYTDFLQFSGPLQTALRSTLGLEGRVLPDIRSLWGAALVFAFCLYPYIYLMARTALSERAVHLMEAAKLLGSPLRERITAVALPLARPAIAAGVALVLMETVADFGVVSYFGVQTFSAGIYKAWLVMDNRTAAAQLASVLLVVVVLLLHIERRAQQRMRFVSSKGGHKTTTSGAPTQLQGSAALLAQTLCSLPVLLGFVLPVLLMLLTLSAQLRQEDVLVPWDAFGAWSWNSLRLASITAALGVAVGLWLTFAQRLQPSQWVTRSVQLASLGYAVPGAVIVVGLLLPITWLQSAYPQFNAGYWLTATSVGLVWAYLVRFNAVAINALQSGYSRIPTSLDESARMLGTSNLGILRHVHAPLLQRSVLTAALLVFVDVMKELPATLVLRPFNADTLAVVTYQLARDERLGEAALPALALVLVGLLPVVLLSKTLGRTSTVTQRSSVIGTVIR
jgi:iron(III) transport system permease protein